MSCLHGDSCGDRNIRGVQVFVGDIRLKGVVKNGGMYSSFSGTGMGLIEYVRRYTFGAFFISICPASMSLFLVSMTTVHSWNPFMSAQ